MGNGLVTPGAVSALGAPVDLSQVRVDSYVVAGISDHITPVAELLPQHPAAGRRHPFRAVHQRPHRGPGQPARQPQGTFQTNKDTTGDAPRWLNPPTPRRAAGGPTSATGSASAAARQHRHPSSSAAAGYAHSPKPPAPTSSRTEEENIIGHPHHVQTNIGRPWAPTTSTSPTSSPRPNSTTGAAPGISSTTRCCR